TTRASRARSWGGSPSSGRRFWADLAWLCSPWPGASSYHTAGEDLLGRERYKTPGGIDVHVELVEEVAPEHTVGTLDRHVLRAHRHAADARRADLEAVDEDELHLARARGARNLRRRRGSRDAHAGGLKRARADDRLVRAGVEQENRRAVAVDRRIDHDAL